MKFKHERPGLGHRYCMLMAASDRWFRAYHLTTYQLSMKLKCMVLIDLA
jgi:hypothetical protein